MTTEEKLEAVRARVHNLNDLVQRLTGMAGEHEIHIKNLRERVEKLQHDVATGEQLNTVKEHLLLQLDIAKTQLESAVAQINIRLVAVGDKLDPIQRGIFWVICLVLGAVILAILGLVLKGGR